MAKADAKPAPTRAYDIYGLVPATEPVDGAVEAFTWRLLGQATGRNHRDALRQYVSDGTEFESFLVVTASSSQRLATAVRTSTVITSA